MGIITQGKILWNALFTRTQRQVLGLLFGHPERSYYANEVVRLAGVGTGSVQRELKRLTDAGILTSRRVGNQKHYQANPDCPIYGELRSIVIKTFGVVDLLRKALIGLDCDIRLAWLFGEAVRGPGERSLNLLIVSGDLDDTNAMARLTEVESHIGRSLSLILMKPDEFSRARQRGHTGLREILNQPGMALIGKLQPAG